MAFWRSIIGLLGTGIGVYILRRYIFRRKLYQGNEFMTNKVVIITGANSGIGKATALEMAKRGAKVIMACRDVIKAKEAAIQIRNFTKNGKLLIKELDLASFNSIRSFVDGVHSTESRIDILINNAGVFQCPFNVTADGLEWQMGVNYFGPFLLTNLLLEKLKTSTPSRIIMVSSSLHKYANLNLNDWNEKKYYNPKTAYNNSKLAINLFSQKLSKKLINTDVSVYCIHPGIVWTNLARHKYFPLLLKPFIYLLANLLLKNPYEGCQTIMYCSCAKNLRHKSGHYYGNCKEEPWSSISQDDVKADELWDISMKVTKLK